VKGWHSLFSDALALELPDVISQALFYITRPVESRSINILIRCCPAGRMIEAKHTSHSGAISKSGGQTSHVGEALGFADCPLVQRVTVVVGGARTTDHARL